MSSDVPVLQRILYAGGAEMVLDLMADGLKDMLRAHDEPTAYLARKAAREALQVYASLADHPERKGGPR